MLQQLRHLWDPNASATRRYPTTISYLQMHKPPANLAQPHWQAPLRYELLAQPDCDFYRQLYDAVGRQWHWVSRREISDQELQKILTAPSNELYVLWEDSTALGFIELNFSRAHSPEIVFLGLVASAIGKGYGKKLLQSGLSRLWQSNPHSVRIQTCTLDHPSALPLYRSAGFTVVKTKHETITERS